MEYSPWSLDIETNKVMQACHELGVTVVTYIVRSDMELIAVIIFFK